MKTILIVGTGRLGRHLCMSLSKLDNEVMIIDRREEALKDLLPYATAAKVGDCTDEEVLRSLGVGNFDLCFVCIGSNFQSSLEVTSLLKELGARYVISKASRDIHAKFLLKNGADEAIYPDRDTAEKLARRYGVDNIFDYVELTEGYSIFEMPPLSSWCTKSIRQLDIRAKYHVSILGVKKDGKLSLLPHADYVLQAEDHLMMIGEKRDIDRLLATIK